MINLRCILFGHKFVARRSKKDGSWEDFFIENCAECGLSKQECGVKRVIKIDKDFFKDFKWEIKVDPKNLYPIEECQCEECGIKLKNN